MERLTQGERMVWAVAVSNAGRDHLLSPKNSNVAFQFARSLVRVEEHQSDE